MNIRIPVSIGELFDKITILEIKRLNITEADKLANVLKEYNYLRKKALKLDLTYTKDTHYKKLLKVNNLLWNIEDLKRQHERTKTFDANFIDLARSVYIMNDERAKIKKAINKKYNSEIIEEKSYKEIVDLTGFSLNEVKSHIQNGKRNLKITLEKGGFP
jgi:hypothetical protein